MNILEVSDLSKNFGGVAALSEIGFTVGKGEFLGIIGGNGAGKTTLFSIISGFDPPSKGNIRFKGEEITGLKPFQICRKGVVRTFQVVRPFRNMSVLKNAAVGRLFGKNCLTHQKKAEREAERILEFVGLSAKAGIPAGELSLADHKRLELARALTTNPDVLLLDEVLAGLTPSETTEAMEIVKKVHQSMGLTILMVEHVMKAVIGLCERIIVIHYGRMIAEGTPKEIAENPDVIEAYLGERLEV
ncbi:MAG: ABC transporter ATP-binding protein [Pseudomonadota bacterium]